jgi:hypothetical protein
MWTWIEEHPYVLLYLVGCVVYVFLSLLHLVIFGLIRWMTKTNTLNKNLRKILPPDERSSDEKATAVFTAVVINVALSWINVLLVIWQTLAGLLGTLRELFSSTPEAVKLLRFPLRNNPNMSREAVWAYCEALKVKAGEKQPSESALRSSLDELLEHYPSFDRETALNELKALKVLRADVVPGVLDKLSASEEEPVTAGSAPAATVTDDSGDEPNIVDDVSWEEGGSHIALYPSQRTFVYKAWWIPGDTEEEYEYRMDPDCHLMCRLRNATETGTKSGEGEFKARFYQDRPTVRDGVIIEDAIRFIYENNSATGPSEEITALSSKTEWHEISSASSWPELWYTVVKMHVGEHEARRGIRKELERLKRGLRIISDETSQWFTCEHDEGFRFTDFKSVGESTSESRRILADALEHSGLTLSEAQGAHFKIKSLEMLLGDG